MTADLFHIGHLKAIEQCAKRGKVVIGLLDCPDYKKTIIPYEERKEILETLPEVYKVVRQDSLDFSENLKELKPDCVASGDGFEKEELAAMEGYGCYEFNLLYYERQNTTKIKNLVKQDFIKEIDRAIRAVHGGGNGRRLLVELRNSLNE